MAIAFDAIGPGKNEAGFSSYTWSHTCSGTNRIVFVAFFGDLSDIATGATYDGVAMTLVRKTNTDSRWIYLYVLINPPTGAKNVVVSFSGNSLIGGNSISYTGVKQTGQPEVSAAPNATPATITTISDNSWTVLLNKSGTGATAGTGSFLRDNSISGSGYNFFDSNGPLTPAGSKSMSVSQEQGNIIAAIAPAVDTFNGKFLQMF